MRYPIPAASLGLIQRLVRQIHQSGWSLDSRTQSGNAEARGNSPQWPVCALKRGPNLLRGPQGAFLARRRQNEHELLAPVARCEVRVSDSALHNLPNLPQYLVSRGMSELVVVLLEVVHIQQNHGDGLVERFCPCVEVVQHLLEMAVVVEAGKPVGGSELAQTLVGGLQCLLLLLQFAVQRAITDMSLREGISFVVVQDVSLNVLASYNPSLVPFVAHDPFLKSLLQTQSHRSRVYRTEKGEEVFEIARSLSANHRPAGIIRIGFSPKEIDPILNQTKKNVAISILIFLCLGLSAVTLVWINQNRHLQKMKELEEHLQRTERLSSLGHLAAGVAHEIRNPLNAIGLGIQRLRREFVPQDTSDKEEYLSFTEVIHREVKRVNEIIEDFLGLSRPFHLDLRLASLEDLLQHLVLLFQEEARSRGLRLEVDCAPDLPPLEIDAQRLTQALVNIMKNGIEAMKPGGILRLEARENKDRITIAITDTGEGIPEDQVGKIFDYYYTTKEKGAGLGLPIAHRIIEAHGGQMEIGSQPGSGTKVTITLPLARKQKD